MKIFKDGDAARHTSRQKFSRGEKRATECRLATLNVQGGIKDKMDEVCEIVMDKRIDILCVNETKRKGKDITKHGSLTAIWSGVPEAHRASQGVGIVLSERMIECVKDFSCVSSRIAWIRAKVGLNSLFIVSVYAPDMGSAHSDREEFWSQLRDIVNGCRTNEKIVMLGDFNSWVGVKRRGYERVLGAYGDDRVNDNGMNLLDICVEKNLSVMNTMFDHRKVHRYTWERQDQRSIIDFVIVDERMKSKVTDTRVYRGVNVGTDHHLVMCRVNDLFKRWRHRASKSVTLLERIKVEKLEEQNIKDLYKKEVKEMTDKVWDSMNEFSLEETWELVRDGILKVSANVCGVTKRQSGKQVKKFWVDDEVKEWVKKKKQAWLNVLACKAQKRTNRNGSNDLVIMKERYREMRIKVKQVVKVKKNEREEQENRKFSDNFRANVKLFWQQVRQARGLTRTMNMKAIRGEDGCLESEESKVLDRWKGYFESLFKWQDGIQGNGDWTEASSTDLFDEGKNGNHESEIGVDEVVKALRCMKLGKAAGYDRVSVEMLKAGDGVVASLLCRLFNMCWRHSRVPDDWCKAVIVPLYKGKGSQQECKSFRGISLLSVVGKLYAKVLINRVISMTDQKLWNVQAGFREGMGCVDQTFSLRCIAEKHLAKHKKVYCAFVDLEKAYDSVWRDELWSTLSRYGVDLRLVRALKSLYRDSSACVRINGAYTDWFHISRGLRQGCVASPWLFNLYIDSCLIDLRESDDGLVMGELPVKCLLYADDQVLLASSAEELQKMVTRMNAAFRIKGMKVNIGKTKVMVFEREESMSRCDIKIDDKSVEQVKEFVYLGSLFTRDGRIEADVERRVIAGNKLNGAMHAVVANQTISEKARLAIHNSVLVPTLMYGSECWVWQKKHESRINAVEMRSLRSMCGVTLKDRLRNEVIRERCGLKEDVVTKVEKSMLRWFGHVVRMDERRLVKGICTAEVSGNAGRGRPRRTYSDLIGDVLRKGQVRSTYNRRACMTRFMSVEEAREVCMDRSRWRSIVSAYPHGKKA